MDQPADMEKLLLSLQNPDANIRRSAAEALGLVQPADERINAALATAAVNDDDREVRIAASRAFVALRGLNQDGGPISYVPQAPPDKPWAGWFAKRASRFWLFAGTLFLAVSTLVLVGTANGAPFFAPVRIFVPSDDYYSQTNLLLMVGWFLLVGAASGGTLTKKRATFMSLYCVFTIVSVVVAATAILVVYGITHLS